jgi:hypothetical protein
MHRHPETWFSEAFRDRIVTVQGSLHFHPNNPEAEKYFGHMMWLREALPDTWITGSYIPLWRDANVEGDKVLFTNRMRAMGIAGSIGCFDPSYLFPDKPPQKPGSVAWCSCGYDYALILPDAATYRCLGHAHFNRQYMGNLKTDGWGIMHEASQPCDELICSACDACTKAEQSG